MCVKWAKKSLLEEPRIRIDEEVACESEDRCVKYRECAIDYNSSNLHCIQRALKKRNLTTTGKKEELSKKIFVNDQQELFNRFGRPLSKGKLLIN
jgi:hypothetical protein